MSTNSLLVTYDEIIKSMKAILECSRANGYLDDYSFLNTTYSATEKSAVRLEQEQVLMQALESLEKILDSTDRTIREDLEKKLQEIAASHIFKIPTMYKDGDETRKLAVQDSFISRLMENSLPTSVLLVVKEEEIEETNFHSDDYSNIFEEIIDKPETKENTLEVGDSTASLETLLGLPTIGEDTSTSMDTNMDFPLVDAILEQAAETASKEEHPTEEVREEPKVEPTEKMDAEPVVEETPKTENEENSVVIYHSNIDWKDTSHAFAVNESQFQKLKESSKAESDTPVLKSQEEVVVPEESVEKKKEEKPLPFTEPFDPKQRVLTAEPEEEPKKVEKTESSEQKKADLSRIQLLKKALDKAKEVNNEQLIKILEQQLIKEVENLKK